MQKYSSKEKALLNLANETVAIYKTRFDQNQITVESPKIEIRNPLEGKYTSEIVINFLKNNNLIDTIEFFAFNNDKEEAYTPEELKKWLESEFEHVLNPNWQPLEE